MEDLDRIDLLACLKGGSMRTGLYLYIISTGAYSEYEVEYFALHEKKFSLSELTQILEECKAEYTSRGLPTKDYAVRTDVFADILRNTLLKRSFRICFATGELHYADHGKMRDIQASIPWRTLENAPSALRIGLA